MTQPHAVRRHNATERTARHTTLRALLGRLDRLTPAEADRLRDCVLTELAETEDLRRTISGQTRAVDEMNGRITAADQAIREVEQERDAARAEVDQLRAERDELRFLWNSARDRADTLMSRAEKAEAAIARVRALHGRWDCDANSCASCVDSYGTPVPYPCPTLRALDGTT